MGNNRYKTSSMLQIKSDAASLTSDDSGIYSAEFVLERNGSRFVAKKDFQVEVESPPVRENIKFETFPPGIGNGKETKRYLETFTAHLGIFPSRIPSLRSASGRDHPRKPGQGVLHLSDNSNPPRSVQFST